MPRFSVIILCYKAEKFSRVYLECVLETLRNHKIDDYEIMLVGNYVPYSNDQTPKVIKALSEEYDKVISVTEPKPNFGWLGWDVRMALEKATGHYVGLIDGDGQMPAQDLANCYISSEKNDSDITMTYRIKRGDGAYRRNLSRMYNLFVRILFPSCCVKDLNSKPKIIKKNLINSLNLKSNGWTIDAEIMLQSFKRKAQIVEIPTRFLGQPAGRKSFVGYKAIFEFVIFLLKQRLIGIK